jgi:hypothetical protein
MIAGGPSLTKPSAPKGAVVRLALKATVVHWGGQQPAGKWEKFAGQRYSAVKADLESGMPPGLGLERMPSYRMLMQENKDRQALADLSGAKAQGSAGARRGSAPGVAPIGGVCLARGLLSPPLVGGLSGGFVCLLSGDAGVADFGERLLRRLALEDGGIVGGRESTPTWHRGPSPPPSGASNESFL